MACKNLFKRKKYLAKLSEKPAPCAFCNRLVDEETSYGKLYSIGDIHCHYFCVLLSCCLVQNGRDEEGLFGFLYHDILAEIERSKKHKCSYCSKDGATLGCSVTQCRKQFHLPCGREKNAVSLFYGNYKSFCKDHAPKQKLPNTIMAIAKLRRSKDGKIKQQKCAVSEETDTNAEMICVICYEKVDGFPTLQTFWPPCCARDAWFHRNCIERMALSAGVHYLKCPLCNDKDNFYKAVVDQGYYVPDRDAAWELEQNAYAEIYERPSVCCVDNCQCPDGREFDADAGAWSVGGCVLCGGGGAHRRCAPLHVCPACAHAAPAPDRLREIDRVSLPSQSQNSRIRMRATIMPSRMSLRRTKGRGSFSASTSSSNVDINNDNVQQSRGELNLKTPKKRVIEGSIRTDNKYSSPIKLIEKEMHERYNTKCVVDFDKVLTEVVEKFRKPRPLVEKRKIVHNIIESLMKNLPKESIKTKDAVREWNSPKKISNNNIAEVPSIISQKIEPVTERKGDIVIIEQKTPIKKEKPKEEVSLIQETPKLKKVNLQNDSMEISENDQIINIDMVKIKNTRILTPDKDKCVQFNPFDGVLQKTVDMDVESFKNQYLHEVDKKFCCNFDSQHKKLENTVEQSNVAVDTSLKKAEKRKLSSEHSVASKKRKTTKKAKNNNKNKTEVSIRNRNINLKIKWQDEELNLKISNRKKRKCRNGKKKVLTQYVISPISSDVLMRPNSDVTHMKRKRTKKGKASDNLKQMSISSFFKFKVE